VLTGSVLADVPDAYGKPSFSLKPSLCELYGHLTAAVATRNAKVWLYYGRLLLAGDGDGANLTAEDTDKVISPVQHRF